MANIKISELEELNKSNDDDLLVIVDSTENETKKIKAKNLGVGGGTGVSGDTFPIGLIAFSPNSIIPTNWLVCDGSAVSRITYANLFDAIGTTYGVGDGSTTFNLPNLKGKIPVGLDSADTDFNSLGKTGGEKTHTLTINELAKHSHKITTPKYYSNETGTGSIYGAETVVQSIVRNSSEIGNNQPHNNLQPYITGNYIIKAFQSAGVVAQVSNTKSTSTTDTYSCDYVNRFGKLLWQGNFTEGSINVEGSTNYSTFIVEVLGTVRCLGSRSYGGSTIGTYGGYAQETYTYRIGGLGDTWTIDSTNKGGSNGTSNVAITAIYGLF